MSSEVAFLGRVADSIRSHHVVLDFGAGRGDLSSDPEVDQRLVNFRGACAHVEGCDIDPAVLENPLLDSATVIMPGLPLPYPTGSFDVIISRSVFEHLASPKLVCRELLRVLKPGGSLYAVTTNRTGYVALIARMIPRRFHALVLSLAQPRRREARFDAHYRLNTGPDVRRFFPHAEIEASRIFGPPRYGPPWIMGAMHRIMPDFLAPQLHVVVRKPAEVVPLLSRVPDHSPDQVRVTNKGQSTWPTPSQL